MLMGYVQIICAILIWSSLGIFIRTIELPNHLIIFYTATIAGTVQLIVLMSSGLLKKARQATTGARDVLFLLLGPLFFIANALLFYYAFRNTTIANSVLTHYTAPVFVALLAPLLLKEKIRRITWIAIACASAGLWMIMAGTNPENSISHIRNEQLGILAGALSGLAYAFLILTIRRIAPLFHALFITFVQNGIVALVLLPFVLMIHLPLTTLPYLVIMGVLHSTIAPYLYVQGFKSVRANEAAILGYFEPVGATVLAFFILHEIPGIEALPGGVLILFSGYLILRSGKADTAL